MTENLQDKRFECLGDDGQAVASSAHVLWGPKVLFEEQDSYYAGYGMYTVPKGNITYPLLKNLRDLIAYIKCVHALRSPWHVTL